MLSDQILRFPSLRLQSLTASVFKNDLNSKGFQYRGFPIVVVVVVVVVVVTVVVVVVVVVAVLVVVVVNKSQIRKFILKILNKRVPGMKEFGPSHRFKEGCSHTPGATLIF